MMTFVLPTEKNRADVLAFYDAFTATKETCIGYTDYADYDRWCIGMQNRHTGENLPKGYVREDFFLCYDGDTMVGVCSLKYELTDYLLHYGGHIGYAVHPAMRCRGLATEILRKAIEIAREYGFTQLLCVCDEDNLPSEKVIQKCGGVLENVLYDAEENVNVKRYWITLS